MHACMVSGRCRPPTCPPHPGRARTRRAARHCPQTRVDSGEWVLVDVRLGEQYEAGHAEGAVSAPMYETIGFQGSDFRRLLKVAMYK